ncbi:MAG: hypothetical protein Q8M67_02535 [Bacteroidota bacterium]|nr:hypothetical protein [Bacteroidota bacterium]
MLTFRPCGFYATASHEIRIKGFRVLVKNLGPADAIRFIQSYTHGSGDYTKERKQWLETDFDAVMAAIKERRKKFR